MFPLYEARILRMVFGPRRMLGYSVNVVANMRMLWLWWIGRINNVYVI